MQESEQSRLLGLVVPALAPELVAHRFLSGAVDVLGARTGAIWLPRGSGGGGGLRRLAVRPEDAPAAEELPEHHPLLAELRQRSAGVYGSGDPTVAGLFGQRGEARGAIVTLAVDPGGVLAFSVPERRGFPIQRVHALRPVAERLGYSLGQALRHRSLEQEFKALKKENATLRYTAGRLRALVENSLDLLFVLGYDGGVQLVSPSVAEITGLTQDELEGTSIFTLIHPDDVGAFIEEFRERLLQRGLGPTHELRLKGQRGWRWVTARLTNRLDDPKVGGVILSCHDITELKHNAEELENARRTAETAGRARAEFLAAMSHEIRTPMNSVIGLASLLEETDLDERQREMLRTIRASGATLVGIINQVLDLARIEAGEIVLRPRAVDLRELVDEVLEVAGPMAAEKGLDLIDEIPDSVPPNLLLDSQRVQQVLLNLVTNAIKHTETGAVTVSVSVSGAADPLSLELAVRDTGHGIPEGQIARIFEPFSQTAEGVRAGGSGLGLTISRQLVEAMGGTIDVSSTVGEGSTFRVTLPVRTAGEPPARPEPTLAGRSVLLLGAAAGAASAYGAWFRGEGASFEAVPLDTPPGGDGSPPDLLVVDTAGGVERALDAVRTFRDGRDDPPPAVLLVPLGHDLGDARPPRTAVVSKPVRRGRLMGAVRRLLDPETAEPTPSGGQRAVAQGRPLRILLAEDNPVNRKVAIMMLERLHHHVEAVSSGPETVDAVRSNAYDVILMDLELPGFGGLEAARRIRAMTLASAPYIVAMTGHVLPADRERCFAAGMDAFLAKPVVLEELRAVLDRVPVAGPVAEEGAGETPEILDRSRLEVISGVTPGLLGQLVELFCADAPERIESISAAIEAGNLHEVAQAAHQLKGAAANMGARELERLARQVENLARTGRREGLADLVEPLSGTFEATRRLLEEAVREEDDGFVEG